VKSYHVANTALSRILSLELCGMKELKCVFSTAVKIYFLDKLKLTLFLYCLVFAFLYVEALVVVSKEIRIEVNSAKTQYMVMSVDQNARTKSHYKYWQ
jgi:hypothetical protein